MQPDPQHTARPVAPRDSAHLAAEWDLVGPARHAAIAEGRDPTYSHVLVPELLRLAADWLADDACVLDTGCGTGKFAAELATNHRGYVTGIDSSERSIEIARSQPTPANLRFERATVEAFAERVEPHIFHLVIANMLLQNVASLGGVLDACRRLLAPDGALVFAIPHPCFWPRYWQYEQAPWFRYDREVWIEAPFRTSLSPANGATTTHTHRPLAQYVQAFTEAGLVIEELAEPMPDDDLAGEYPTTWECPRLLLGRCRPLPRGGRDGA